jgi:hypothetical protein
MTVYVDNANIAWRGMIMCHLFADTLPELLAMVDRIGVKRRWLQKPPKASWIHFDIGAGKKRLALIYGAVETDIFGPLEWEARQLIATGQPDKIAAGRKKLEMVENSRRLRADTGFKAKPLPPPAEPVQESLPL